MAEINDELAETLRRLTEEMANMNAITLASNKSLRDQLNAAGKLTKGLDDLSHTIEEENQVREEAIAREQAFKSAQKNSIDSLRQFGSAITNVTDNSFSKYESGIKSATSAISDIASQFGPLGKAISMAAGAVGTFAGAILKQTDAVVKGYDDLSKIGGAAGLTADGIFQLGKEAGFSSFNLGTFTKNIKDVDGNLVAFGGRASEGVKTFTQFVAVGEDQLKAYRRLGYTQDELIEAQTTYMKLQVEGGTILTKNPKDLQKASLEYLDQLNALADITGISVKKQQEAQTIANNQAQFNLYTFAKSQEMLELEKQEAEARKEGNKQRGDELKAQRETIKSQLEAKKSARDFAYANMDQKEAAAFTQSIISDKLIVTEQNAAMVRSGRLTQEMLDKTTKGIKIESDMIGAEQKAVKDYLKNLGPNAYILGDASGKIAEVFGVNLKVQQNVAKMYNKEMDTAEGRAKFEKERLQAEKDIAAKKEKGVDGQKAVDMAAERSSAERQVVKALDSIIDVVNPFTGSVKGSTAAAVALTAAAAAATFALGKLAASQMGGLGGLKDLASKIPGLGGLGGTGAKAATTVATAAAPAAATAATGAASTTAAASSAAGALAKLAAPLAGLAKAAPVIGTVAAVGSGMIETYQGIKKADKELEEGKITKEEAKVQKGEAVGGGIGTAAGGAAGALKGAAIGAALGSAVPIVGNIIGGLLGAAVGGWLGSKAGSVVGEVVGGSVAKMTQDADKKVDESVKSVEAKREAIKKNPNSKSTYEVNGRQVSKEEYDAFNEQMKADRPKPLEMPDLPKKAKGGITSGPSIAGEAGPEAVVPLPDNKTIPVQIQSNTLSNETEDDEELEFREKLNEELKDSELTLKKLTASLVRWDDLAKEQIKLEEEKQEKTEELQKSTSVVSQAFKLASIDLSKFSSQIKVKIEEGKGTKSSPTAPSTAPAISLKDNTTTSGTGITPSKQAGTGITPGAKAGEGIQISRGQQQELLLGELKKQGITDNSALANIMAQVQAESGFKPRSEEVGRYSAKTLYNLYGPEQSRNKVRFKSMEEAESVVSQGPEAVGNLLYGGRMGNAADEGYKYRGRGLIQLTGKSNYERYGKLIGVDLVENPDLANDPDIASKLAVAYFKDKEKRGVDLTDIRAVGKAVGYAGGEAETQKRAQLAQGFSSKIQEQPAKAQFGGIFSGPMTGYPVELHGDEVVAPLDTNSMLAKMLTSPPGEQQKETIQTMAPTSNDFMLREMQSMNVEMMDMIAGKLDAMIDALGTSNDLQGKLVTYSRV